MDDATVRLVVAAELREVVHVLKDDSNGTSDCAMARRIAINHLLSCRAINDSRRTGSRRVSATVLIRHVHRVRRKSYRE
jgi:hypothetical protein